MISVIIPTRNRADLLAMALQSMARQTLSPDKFEVLVIDNGSSDHTLESVEKMAASLPNLKYYFEAEPGLHSGRHRGLEEAAGDILVFADDDIQATSTWCEAISENFANPKVAMVGGNNLPDFKQPPPAWLSRLWKRPAFGGQAITLLSILSLPDGRREINPYLVWGCNFSIRKQVILDAGGFHPDGMPGELLQFRGDGETHISHYVSGKSLSCVFDSRASVFHAVTPARMTFDYFRQNAFNHGISDSYTQLRKTRENGPGTGLAGHVGQWIRNYKNNRKRWDMGSDPELKKLSALVKEGYMAGYSFHRQKYNEDPAVRAWVHKPDYFSTDLLTLSTGSEL